MSAGVPFRVGEDGAVAQAELEEGCAVGDLLLAVERACEEELVVPEAALHHPAALLVVLQPALQKAYSPRMKALLL